MENLMPKDIAQEVADCERCPYRVAYTDYEDTPREVCYCALKVSRGTIVRYWHGDIGKDDCPLDVLRNED